MRRRRRFCVRCGAEDSPENPVIGHLCLRCLTSERVLATVKHSPHIVVCPICGSYMVENTWVKGYDDPEETIAMLAERLIENNIEPVEPADDVEVKEVKVERRKGGKYFATVRVAVNVKGRMVEQTLIVPLDVVKRPCPNCLKKSGKDYDAVLQIRSERGSVTDEELRMAGEVFAKVGSGEDIVELVDVKEGLDVLLTNKEVAKRAASLLRYELGAKVTESQSVVGMTSSGKLRTRLTISIRLPNLREGEPLLYKGEPAIFTGFSRGKFYLYLLPSERDLRVDVDEWWDLRKKGEIQYLRDIYNEIGVVTSEDPLKVKVGDEVVEAEGPIGLRVGQEVYVIEYKGKVYVLPKEG